MRNTSNIKKGILIAFLLVCLPMVANAQRWTVSTNALSWASLGTINAEGSYSLSQNFSVNLGGSINPWEASSPTGVALLNKHYGGYLGIKYWPWHVYSEWWINAKVQYRNFEHLGILTQQLVTGDAVGGGLSAGYSFMLSNRFNLDVGAGFWGGKLLNYKKYQGTQQMETEIEEQGSRTFFFLDNMILSIIYIF